MNTEVKSNLMENINFLKKELKNCDDVIFKKITIGDTDGFIIYSDGMVDNKLLTEGILNKLSNKNLNLNSLTESVENLITVGQILKINSLDEAINKILSGGVVLFISSKNYCLNMMLPDYPSRGVEKADLEPSVKGPKEAFTETLNTNVALIRKRLSHKQCKFEEMNLGNYVRSKIAIAYIDDLTNKDILNEAIKRLNVIKNTNPIDVNYIEEFIEDNPHSLYPTMQTTERPDKVVSSLLEGRIAILQENSPYALIIPCFFSDFFQAPDEYYYNYWFGSFIRFLRYLGYIITIFLPALYIAITAFNQEMLPTKLLITIQKQTSGVPFPPVLEAVFMELAFEIMREAGSRLPQAIGSTISIVGGLVIGDAVVKAGLVSPAIVVVIAFTAITSFLTASVLLNSAKLYLRIASLILSGLLGLWGIFIILLLNLAHLASLTSFGVPYLTPFSPNITNSLKNVLYRPPVWNLKNNRLNIFNKKYTSIINRNNSKPNRR